MIAERTPRVTSKIACMMCPGGLDHSGGIGRWAGYLQSAWPADALVLPPRIVDTRGYGGIAVGVAAFARALAELAWLRATGRLGLIHASLCENASAVRVCIVSELASWFGVPVIIQMHAGRFPEFYRRLPGWAQAAVRRAVARAMKFIILGKAWEAFVTEELRAPRSKIMILYNGVPSPVCEPSPRMPDRPCHIVMLARLEPAKGVSELLDALGSDALRPLAWRATLAGDGEGPYRDEASRRDLGERVAFPGWIDQASVSALLGDADILVLPSHFEGLPVSVVEAMAHGVAVVTTPVGATPEIVVDGESALLTPVGDSAALAGALKTLIEAPALRARIGRAGRRAFEARLDVRRSARFLSDLYAGILTNVTDPKAKPGQGPLAKAGR